MFAKEQEFLAVSRDGRTLLRTVDKNTVGILHLDRALWKKELCDTAWASVSAVRVKFLILVV
ncbi:hypothetical protein [Streptomyces zagrosensis]|uniref:Uncharacterized protein n=1 Tax=Streptomyces zagrosensis TaxID=1042984 RepID=A0A7W9QFL3_9ACTN|nr:hypothetical protein [Streptomyces zagrosensis]MBB5939231.1 hypothetical protein [Streptomyces zagrosensis]